MRFVQMMHSVSKPTFMLGNNRGGITMLYTVAAMLLAASVGSSLLNMTHKEVVAGGDFGDLAEATLCAEGGLLNFEANMTERPDKVVAAINNYLKESYTAADKGWLVGGPDEWDFIAPRQKYNARITGFDRTSLSMQVEITGVAVGQGRKVIRAIYLLQGVTFPTSGVVATHALYLGSGMGTIKLHERMNVNGNTYIGSSGVFDNYTSGSTFDGEFRTITDPTKSFTMQGNYTFKGPTYFGMPTLWNVGGAVSFEDQVAFAGNIDGGGAENNFSMKDNMYIHGAVGGGWSTTFVLTNNMLVHDGKVTLPGAKSSIGGFFKNYTAVNDGGATDLLGVLDMQPAEPKEVEMDQAVIASIPSDRIHTLNGTNNEWSGSTINAIYDAAKIAEELWNDYLVVEIPVGATLNLDDQDKPREAFKGKVLYIIRGKVFVGSTGNGLYNSANTAISVFYVANGGSTENIGGWDGDFRGYFYCEKGGRLCLGGSTNSTKIKGQIKGGVNCAEGAASFDWYPITSGLAQINFDDEIIKDIAETGLLKSPDGVAGTEQSETLKLVGSTVTHTQIAVLY